MVLPVDIDAMLEGRTQRLHPKVRVVWTIESSAPFLVAGVVAAVALSIAGVDTAFAVAAGGLGLVLALGAAVFAVLAWSRFSWCVWPDAVEVRHGVIWRQASLVPFHRIQQVDVGRGPLERMLGLATLELHTAAATSDARVPGISDSVAEKLRRALLERAGVDDAV